MKNTGRVLLAIGLAIVASAYAGHASAQAAPREDKAGATEAERLFREGVEAANAGDYATACAKLARSLDLVTRASTLLNLAVCEAEQGKLAQALKRYESGIALLPPGDERLEKAARNMEEISKRVPRVTVKLAPTTPESARVLIDGSEVAHGELANRPLDAGEHVLLLAAPGHRDVTQRIVLKEGERITVTLEAGAPIQMQSNATPAQHEPKEKDDDLTLRIAGFAVLGVGVLGAIGAGVTGGLLIANDDTIEQECPNQRCSPLGLDTIDESETLIVANYVSWGVAIAGVGTGAALLIADAILGGKDDTEAAVVVLPGGGFATMRVRF